MHAMRTLHFAGVVLDARGRWSCAHRQLPIRPQINRHARPPEEGSTTAGGSVVEPGYPFTTTSLFREADISIVSAVSTRSWTDKEWFEMVEMK